MKFLKQLVEEIKPEEVKLNIKYHTELNPALWNGITPKPEVQEKLEEIANIFIKFLNIPDLTVVDIVLTGSAANFNYTAQSDIDLHIEADLDKLHKTCGRVVITELLAMKKIAWNDMHDIKIRGFAVELYTQDEKEKHTSTGIYSLKNKKWIIKPTHQEPKIDHNAVKNKAAHLMNEIDNLRNGSVSKLEEIEKLKDKIKKLRQSGLEKEGEFSVENLVFKTLRNNGYLEKLFDAYTNTIDKTLSL